MPRPWLRARLPGGRAKEQGESHILRAQGTRAARAQTVRFQVALCQHWAPASLEDHDQLQDDGMPLSHASPVRPWASCFLPPGLGLLTCKWDRWVSAAPLLPRPTSRAGSSAEGGSSS